MTRLPTREVLAIVAGVTVLAGLTACGSAKHSSQPATTPALVTASVTPSAVGSSADAATTTAVTSTFVQLFNGAASIESRLPLLQSGDAFAQALSSQASSPLLKLTTATVSSVTSVAPNQAHVVYTVLVSGTPALTNQSGTAVQVNGSWKVSAGTFCSLLSLGGQTPAPCTQASVTALPS